MLRSSQRCARALKPRRASSSSSAITVRIFMSHRLVCVCEGLIYRRSPHGEPDDNRAPGAVASAADSQTCGRAIQRMQAVGGILQARTEGATVPPAGPGPSSSTDTTKTVSSLRTDTHSEPPDSRGSTP